MNLVQSQDWQDAVERAKSRRGALTVSPDVILAVDEDLHAGDGDGGEPMDWKEVVKWLEMAADDADGARASCRDAADELHDAVRTLKKKLGLDKERAAAASG